MEHCYIFIFKNSCIKGTSQFKPMLFEGQLYFYMFQYVVFNAFVFSCLHFSYNVSPCDLLESFSLVLFGLPVSRCLFSSIVRKVLSHCFVKWTFCPFLSFFSLCEYWSPWLCPISPLTYPHSFLFFSFCFCSVFEFIGPFFLLIQFTELLCLIFQFIYSILWL